MIILGISYLSDAGACIVKDGVLKSAINEERLNRIKLYYGIPEKSIQWVLIDSGITMKDVDVIVTQGFCSNEPGIEFIDHGLLYESKVREDAFNKVERKIEASALSPQLKQLKLQQPRDRYKHENHVIYERNINLIRQFKNFAKPIKVVEHHISHAAAAYFTSGWDDCYVMTADGWGEMESNIFCRAKGGKLEKLYYSHSFDSLGYFYGSITKALGFIPHRHEGKILGLAAAGHPSKELKSLIAGMISYNQEEKRFEGGFAKGIYTAKFENLQLEEAIRKYKREDVARVAQDHLESLVIACLKDVLPKPTKLAVAGGIFANVKLNQRILELPKVKDLYVYPQMGDGGLSVGSAMYYYSTLKRLKPVKIKTLYLGPAFSNKEVESNIRRFGYSYKYHKNIEKEIARLLARGNIVMRFAGRMEYGPRALGNRSILCYASDKTANQWLNNVLRRSEFMPFAPVTLKEKAEKCYKNVRNYWKRALYMTVTFDCTKWMKEKSAAVVHIDGSARPQLITPVINSSYYKILKYYYKLTGLPTLINTSFNMHEEPIVCTPNDALRTFQDSKLKYLAIENYLVGAEQNDSLFEYKDT